MKFPGEKRFLTKTFFKVLNENRFYRTALRSFRSVYERGRWGGLEDARDGRHVLLDTAGDVDMQGVEGGGNLT